MKKQDNSKASLVEFLRSIKFEHGSTGSVFGDAPKEHFASFTPRARVARAKTTEDSQLVRSAN